MLMDGSEMLQRILWQVPNVACAALAILLVGCSSSSPSTTQAPPETPERALAGTESAGAQVEGGEARSAQESRGSQGGSENEADEGGKSSAGQPPAGSAASADEAVAELDSKLAGELSKFDQQMSEEMRRLAEEAEAAEEADATSAGGSSAGGPSAGSGAGAEGRTGGNTDSGESSGGEVGGSGAGTTESGRVPPDVGDGSDDDIVARQLRQAAMEEDDPELREKLWDEYRRYKASLASSSAKDE
jgi:hypothetical protein